MVLVPVRAKAVYSIEFLAHEQHIAVNNQHKALQ